VCERLLARVSATGAGLFEHAISLAKGADSYHYKERGDQVEVRSGRTVCRRRKWRTHNRDTDVHHWEMPGSVRGERYSVRREVGSAQRERVQCSARGGQRSERKDPAFGARWAALSARGSSLRRDVASAQSEGSSLQRAAASMPVSTCQTAESPVHFSRGWEFLDWTRLVSARYTPGRAPWIPLTGTVDPFDANAAPSFETAHPLGENADARRAGRARLLDARGRDGAVLSQRARR
jgi:hypothetical protein